MKKILIIGNAGAGKTTFAHQLASKLQLPLIHLDKLYWCGDWGMYRKKSLIVFCKQNWKRQSGSLMGILIERFRIA